MYIETTKGKLPVRYNWNALAKFGDMTDKSMDDILRLDMRKMRLSEVLALMLVGFMEGARKEGEECKVNTTEEVADLIDDDAGLIEKMSFALVEMTKAPEPGEKTKKK